MLWCGVDPGRKGAIAVFNDRTGSVAFADMPMKAIDGKKTILDVDKVCEHFRVFRHMPEGFLLVVEQLHGFGSAKVHEDGHRHSFGQWNFAMDYGQLLGAIKCLKLPFILVTPQRWMKVCNTDKHTYPMRAVELFPHAELKPGRCKKPKDGRAAALLMAYCGKLTQKK